MSKHRRSLCVAGVVAAATLLCVGAAGAPKVPGKKPKPTAPLAASPSLAPAAPSPEPPPQFPECPPGLISMVQDGEPRCLEVRAAPVGAAPGAPLPPAPNRIWVVPNLVEDATGPYDTWTQTDVQILNLGVRDAEIRYYRFITGLDLAAHAGEGWDAVPAPYQRVSVIGTRVAGLGNYREIRSDFAGWMLVVSDEPIVVSGHLRTSVGYGDERTQSVRELRPFPVDCSHPRGFEFACGFDPAYGTGESDEIEVEIR